MNLGQVVSDAVALGIPFLLLFGAVSSRLAVHLFDYVQEQFGQCRGFGPVLLGDVAYQVVIFLNSKYKDHQSNVR